MSTPVRRIVPIAATRGRQRGVAAVEFALVVTLTLLLLLAVIGYGALFWTQQQLSAAAGEGARAGMLARYAGRADVQDAACDAALGVFGPATQVDCNRAAGPAPCAWAGAGGAAVGCVDVVLRYDMAQWPLLRSFQGLLDLATGGAASGLVPVALTARAVIQITQEPL
ncbi:TadE/TadG family type IV pilus assembly protein [Bordetella petrii]|uniref:TadE/TadG family type IV pilus assembly protein n=1 Tax=Bordetella petrii TaxID=94624 RepID=UPI003731322E